MVGVGPRIVAGVFDKAPADAGLADVLRAAVQGDVNAARLAARAFVGNEDEAVIAEAQFGCASFGRM